MIDKYQSRRIKALKLHFGDDAVIERNEETDHQSDFKVNGKWFCVDTNRECLLENSWIAQGLKAIAKVKAGGMWFYIY